MTIDRVQETHRYRDTSQHRVDGDKTRVAGKVIALRFRGKKRRMGDEISRAEAIGRHEGGMENGSGHAGQISRASDGLTRGLAADLRPSRC